MMRFVRVTIGKLLAATLLTLCVGVQALEATGRWDRTFQDTGDEAVIVTVVLCIGAALVAAGALRRRLSPSTISSAIVGIDSTSLTVFVPPAVCSVSQRKSSPQSADLALTRESNDKPRARCPLSGPPCRVHWSAWRCVMRQLLVGMLVLLNVAIGFAQESARLRMEVRSDDGPVRDADVVINGLIQKTGTRWCDGVHAAAGSR